MDKELFQPIKGKGRLSFSARLLAGVAIAGAGVLACNSQETDSSNTQPDTKANPTPIVLTMEQMGADAPQGLATPKVFNCGIECITPEDLEKLNRQGKTIDPITYEIIPMAAPKVFRCDAACIGPIPTETPASQLDPINY